MAVPNSVLEELQSVQQCFQHFMERWRLARESTADCMQATTKLLFELTHVEDQPLRQRYLLHFLADYRYGFPGERANIRTTLRDILYTFAFAPDESKPAAFPLLAGVLELQYRLTTEFPGFADEEWQKPLLLQAGLRLYNRRELPEYHVPLLRWFKSFLAHASCADVRKEVAAKLREFFGDCGDSSSSSSEPKEKPKLTGKAKKAARKAKIAAKRKAKKARARARKKKAQACC